MLNKPFPLIAFGFLSSVSALAIGGGAVAQDSTARADNDAGRDTIIVTSRRREENLADVPASVSAFTAEDIETMGIDSPKDFLHQTPGVFYRTNTTAGTAFVNIRGISASRNAESPVAVVVDGVYLNNPLGFQNELIDVEQIEVLKGPQGALYGRNASAGAIIITTKQPTNEFEGKITVGYGRNNWHTAEASFGGPIIEDQLLFRVAAYQRGHDGFFRNEFLSTPGNPNFLDSLDNRGIKGRLLFNPEGNFTGELRAGYTETRSGFNDNPGLASGIVTGDEDIVFSNPAFDLVSNVDSFSNRETTDVSLKLDLDLGFGTLTSISAYSDLEEISGGDDQPLDSVANTTQSLINTYETFSQELRFTSAGDSPFRYILGGYFQTTDRVFANALGTDTGQGLLVVELDPVYGVSPAIGSVNPKLGTNANFIDQTAWAVFAQFEYDITDQLELSAAVRYDEDDETADSIQLLQPGSGGAPVVIDGTAFEELVTLDRNANFDDWQPKATLSYKPVDGLNIYATYAEGFKNGGFNNLDVSLAFGAIPNVFLPESTRTIEGGFKSSLLDDRLTFNSAVYWTKVDEFNYFEVALGPSGPSQANGNIDEVEFIGFEFDFNYAVTDTITFTGSGNVIDSEITENTRFAGDASGDPAGAIGNNAPYFPKHSFAAMVDWRDDLTDRIQGFANLQVNHIGEVQWDLREEVVHDPQTFVDARLGVAYGADDAPWRLTVFCRNCTNNDYIIESLPLVNNAIVPHFQSRDSRIFGFEVSKEF